MEGSKEKKKTEAATERETKKKSDTLETSLLEVAVPPFSKCDNPDIIWVPKISVIKLLKQFCIYLK